MTNQPLPKISNPLGGRSLALKGVPLAMLLVASGTGCYRATGAARPTVVAEQIPATGGDRVAGSKATAGPGDYYMGNDNIHLAVDGAVFGQEQGQFGAPSGGSILDVGSIALDQSFKRVPLPTDNVERIGVVVNQDPELPLVFENYTTSNQENTSTLSMTGHVFDPKGKLNAPRDASSRVIGLDVQHSITLQNAQLDVELLTVITNHSGVDIPLRNIADYLTQEGGGFRFVVPAAKDSTGADINGWGTEIPQVMGDPFTIGNSVEAPMVGLMGAEPSAGDMDIHQSLGFMPVDEKYLLVASDPQQALTEDRPKFPHRLAVGGLPVASLPTGQSLSYRRRLFVVGGHGRGRFEPVETTGIFNLIYGSRSFIDKDYLGVIFYTTAGSARLKGPLQAEVRFERYQGSYDDPAKDPNPVWTPERIEWREAAENFLAGGQTTFSPAIISLLANDTSRPGQQPTYRVVVRNREQSTTFTRLHNSTATGGPLQPILLQPAFDTAFSISEYLSPEHGTSTSSGGSTTTIEFVAHSFYTRQTGANLGLDFSFQPLRFTFAAVDGSGAFVPAKDPDIQRLRFMAGSFNPYLRLKQVDRNGGGFQFLAGNQLFGSAFVSSDSDGTFYFKPGSYVAMGTRGPLGTLTSLPIQVSLGQQDLRHAFLIDASPIPTGWSSFDEPGPSQITSGGMLTSEQFASALAEGLQVVARAEMDKLVDAPYEVSQFLGEFDPSVPSRLTPIKDQLFALNGRRTRLAEGEATSLFAHGPDPSLQFAGAVRTTGWTLADFIARAEGQFTIIHRPRGPQGLFTRKGGIAPGVALGTGANAWWTATDPLSQGKATGDFDAIELLRAEGCDANDPSAWFAEFKTLRQDWFNLLDLQTPTSFTKGLGLSSGLYSLDTPVGLARTYLKTGATPTAPLSQSDLSPVLNALRSGAAVASTGPLLDVNLNGAAGPGALVAGPAGSVTLNVSLYAPAWVPVQEVRVVVNGVVVQTLDPSSFMPSLTDSRLRTTQVTLDLNTLAGGKDAWVVVEAGVPLSTSGAYAVGTPWNKVMKGIYPIAVTNPIFVDVNGGGYTPPLP